MRFLKFTLPVIAGLMASAQPQMASAQLAIGVSVHIAPPALPVYVQPPLPEPGYIWTPGYWAYGDDGYYWVPGTWVEPPTVGVLWTPAWWGWNDGVYAFHPGYWGPHIGFYGGINYGFGYNGVGFFGGHWDHGAFAYNGAVNNFGGTHITNVYRENVVNNTTINRTSFNGGNGGIAARPSPEQEAAEHEEHVQPTAAQAQHFEAARGNPALRATANHGRPAVAATARPGEFSGHGVVPARAAAPGGGRPANAGQRPAAQAAVRPATPHPAARPQAARPAAAPRPPAAPHPVAPHPAAPHPAARPAAPPRPAPHPAPHEAPHEEPHRE
jgi:hypothetical protein